MHETPKVLFKKLDALFTLQSLLWPVSDGRSQAQDVFKQSTGRECVYIISLYPQSHEIYIHERELVYKAL